MAFRQGHDTPLSHWQQLCELLSRSNLTLEVMARCRYFFMCALWLWPWRYDLGSRSWHTLGLWITIVWMTIKIQLDSKEFGPDKSLGMYVLWPWPWRYDLGSRSWHTLGSLITSVWNIIQIQLGSEELWLRVRQGFWVCAHCDLCLGNITLAQGYDTSLGHGQHYPDPTLQWGVTAQTDFGYVCTQIEWSSLWSWWPDWSSRPEAGSFSLENTVTLNFEIWPFVKIMTRPSAMDNYCVKYYSDLIWQWGVLTQTWTLGQGMFALWPWTLRYDLESRSWHILGLWRTSVWNITHTGLSAVIRQKSHVLENFSISVNNKILTKTLSEKLTQEHLKIIRKIREIWKKNRNNTPWKHWENHTIFGERDSNNRHQGIRARKMAFEGLEFRYPNTTAFVLGKHVSFLIVC